VIDNAQRSEGVAPITIDPVTFASLSGPEQIFVTTNLECIVHGLAPVQLLPRSSTLLQLAVSLPRGDPSLNGWTLTGSKAVTSWDGVGQSPFKLTGHRCNVLLGPRG
jgi:hypothetical protein